MSNSSVCVCVSWLIIFRYKHFFVLELVYEIGLFEKQLGINCTREQNQLFGTFLQQPLVEITDREKSDLFTRTVSVNLSLFLKETDFLH